MKIVVASDIHGSAYYCEKLLCAFNTEKANRLLLLGDILYHGPRNQIPKDYNPQKVAAMLNERKEKLLCVRGNCDAEVDQMMLDFPIQADYCILSAGERLIYATHGHIINTNNLAPIAPKDILLHGHTHVVAWRNFGDNNLYLNPGSISLPKQDSQRGYIVLTDDQAQFKTLDGDVYHVEKL